MLLPLTLVANFKLLIMKKSNLTVDMVYLTPEIAKNYLTFNTRNRKDKPVHVDFLAKQMEDGLFLENGESIVFDYNHQLVDGQHRLMAIEMSGKSYNIPVVRGVIPSSMATMDTGKNRSASDVLEMNNFKYPKVIAPLISQIFKFKFRKSKARDSYATGRPLNNQQILEFCKDNYEWIEPLVKRCVEIGTKARMYVVSQSQLSLMAYLIGGENPEPEVYDFLKHLMGVNVQESTAPNYIFTKLYNSKVNKEPLNFYWVLGMTIKAWNYYTDGNPAIKRYMFKVDKPLPKPLKPFHFSDVVM